MGVAGWGAPYMHSGPSVVRNMSRRGPAEFKNFKTLGTTDYLPTATAIATSPVKSRTKTYKTHNTQNFYKNFKTLGTT